MANTEPTAQITSGDDHDETEAAPENHDEVKKEKRNVFDTELIRATARFRNQVVDFWIGPGLDGNEVISGIPVAVDKYFIKIELRDSSLNLGDGVFPDGTHFWISKSAITGMRIRRN
jgi:hypothetical protein